jgi:phenol hydroxylase P0 protein
LNPDIFDVTRKFVRVTGCLPNGFITFEFAVGEPDVFVELVMPQAAFESFCRDNHVETLPTAAPLAADSPHADFQWSLHQATHQRFR